MRILVTGGTGFIGRSLCRRLLADDHAVSILSRRPATVAGLFAGGPTPIPYPLHAASLSGHDAIINLAGAPIFGARWTASRKQVLRDSRVALTERLVTCIGQANPRPGILISGSAIGYYGDQGDTTLDETSASMDSFSHALCADWEHAAQGAREFGVRVCTVRTGVVIGPGGGLLQRMSLPFRSGLGGRLGTGRQWMSWIHIEDHVSAMLKLLCEPTANGPYNLTAPHPVTNGAFTATLARRLRRPAFLHLPAPLLKLLFGEMAELMLGSQRVIPARLMQELNFSFRFPTLDGALAHCLGQP